MSNVMQIGPNKVNNVEHFFYVVKYRPNVTYIITGLFILLYFHMP